MDCTLCLERNLKLFHQGVRERGVFKFWASVRPHDLFIESTRLHFVLLVDLRDLVDPFANA